MKLLGRKVKILKGTSKGKEGYVRFEDQDSVAIEAHGYFGEEGYYGLWYARKDEVEISDEGKTYL